MAKRPKLYIKQNKAQRGGFFVVNFKAILFVVAIILTNYFVFFKELPQDEPTLEERINKNEQVPEAPAKSNDGNLMSPHEIEEDDADLQLLSHKLKKGQTVIEALQSLGLKGEQFLPAINSMKEVFDFRKVQAGDMVTITTTAKGHLASMTLKTSPLDVYEAVVNGDGTFDSVKKSIPTETHVTKIGCSVSGTLYKSLVRCGGSSQLATMFVDLFAWDMDFFSEARNGDEIRLLVEKVFVEGKFLKYDRIIAAEYSGKYGVHQAFLYTDPNGETGYYNAQGESMEKSFLKVPLKYSKLSASRSHKKFKPVIHKKKKHMALDYYAPEGTPVWAVAGGTVKTVKKTYAFGKTLEIKHDNGYTTKYGHLTEYAKGLKKGDRVEQKQLVGFVGETGIVSTPRLYFAVKWKGSYKNPKSVKNSPLEVLDEGLMDDFREVVNKFEDALRSIDVLGDGEKNT